MRIINNVYECDNTDRHQKEYLIRLFEFFIIREIRDKHLYYVASICTRESTIFKILLYEEGSCGKLSTATFADSMNGDIRTLNEMICL